LETKILLLAASSVALLFFSPSLASSLPYMLVLPFPF